MHNLIKGGVEAFAKKARASALLARMMCAVMCMIIANISYAQMGTLYDTNQQLSSSFVKQVYQDKRGVIWVTTNNGLNSYDGYKFYTYGTKDGLGSDNVNCIIQDDNTSKLYVGTINGLNIFTPQGFEQVTHLTGDHPVTAYITSMRSAPNGDIYVATSGDFILKICNGDKAESVRHDIPELRYCHSLTIDLKGRIWVATDSKGVYCLEYKNKKYNVVSKHMPKEDGGFPVICHDNRNNIYVGYLNGGVYKNFQLIPGTENLKINDLVLRKDNNINIGTDGTGLKLLNTATNTIHDPNIYTNQIDMNRAKVYSTCEDKFGNQWLALYQKGIFMIPSPSGYFHYIGSRQGGRSIIGDACIMAVFKQKNGTLWVSTDCDGLYAIKDNNILLKHYMTETGVAQTTILSMTEDLQGRLWIGTYTKGFGWIDAATGTYHRTSLSYTKGKNVFDIRRDYKGRLWVGTLGDGLLCYDPLTEETKQFISDGSNKTLCNNYVLQMDMSPDGKTLFVGTAGGLSCLDIDSQNWTKVMGTNALLQGKQIISVKFSTKTGLWIGASQDNGVMNYPLAPKGSKTLIDTDKSKNYTTKDGLPGTQVLSIETDKRGDIWMSTNYGLCRLDSKTNAISRFYVSDGLQGNEYNEGASFVDNQGVMYFGGTSGLSYFDPISVKPRKRTLNVSLMHFFMGNQRIHSGMKSGSNVICDKFINESERFDFAYDDNNLTLIFSTLLYSAQERISFSYSINGGKEWITLPPGKNELTLSNLPPGDYDIQVVAIDNGEKSEPKRFLIVIHNPWYLTPFARLIYFLILCALVWWYIKNLRMRNQQRMELNEHKHAEELNEQKLQSFINISHEIRTPMTLIVGPLLQLMKEDDDAHRQATYQVIKRNTERILRLVNQILDIRKVDKGQMTMQMQDTDMKAFVGDVLETFRLPASNKGISMEFVADDIRAWIDRSQFDKVLMNLMSNALKYSPNCGKIKVTIDKTDTQATPVKDVTKYLRLTVFDNGEKIPESDLPNIFKRFYQSKTTTNHTSTGTGVGLDLTRSLVLLHHGDISVRNVEDGVEFIVTIPMGNAHLTPEEIATWEEKEEVKAETEESTDGNDLKTLEQVMDVEETANTTAPAEHRSTSKRPTVVVVDDDDDIRNYIIAEMSSTYRCLGFPNGGEALPAILRERPQLIISDIMMPVMDGNTLCAKVKANVNTNHVPVILLTAKTRDEDKLVSLETGADMYITKPFNMDILKRSAANLLNTRKLMENKYTGKEDQSDQLDEIEITSADEKLLSRIMAVINENLSNSDLNIDMICQSVGISRVHLHRKMKELTNQTPHDFIRNLRMKQAAKMLSHKGQSITEVLYRCGFNSATSFSTMFKKMYGMSPREYQKQHEQ